MSHKPKDNRKYQIMPDMSPHQFEALKLDIQEQGVLTPIDIDEEGNILDGHHRFRACQELGITNYPTIVRLELSEEEKRLFARKSNMMRRHLNRKQIRELIAAQLKETPQWSNNRVAKELGVDSKTVKTVRKSLEATSEIPKLTKLEGIDGKTRGKRKPAIMVASEKQKKEILAELEKSGIEIPSGFMTGESFMIHSENPKGGTQWDDLSKEEQDNWEGFGHFLEDKEGWEPEGIAHHLEWLIRRFDSIEEWLGEEGDKWRRIWGMHPIPEDLKISMRKYIKDREVKKLE